jgi:hypothetical protein
VLKIVQEIPATFLELLLEVLRILARLVAKGLRDLLMREEGLVGLRTPDRPQQQTQHLLVGWGLRKVEIKTLTHNEIAVILTDNVELCHNLPPFGKKDD